MSISKQSTLTVIDNELAGSTEGPYSYPPLHEKDALPE